MSGEIVDRLMAVEQTLRELMVESASRGLQSGSPADVSISAIDSGDTAW